jgi:hypothetical protein
MAALTTYLKNALYNEVLRNTNYVPPAVVYLALHTADPTVVGNVGEVTGNAYVRQSIAFDAPTAGAGDNTSTVTFPAATPAAWTTITHFTLWDAETAGNALIYGALTNEQVIGIGNVFDVLAGDLDITFA